MIEGTITGGLSVSEVIRCLEKHHMVLAMKAKALSMNIGGSHEASLIDRAEKGLATAIHERDCLSVAIHTLSGLA